MKIATFALIHLYICVGVSNGDDWVTYLGNQYFFSNSNMTWNESWNDCLSKHANLTSIGDIGEQQFLSSEIANRTRGNTGDYWIGLATSIGNNTCGTNTALPDCIQNDSEHSCCKVRRNWTWISGASMTFMQWMTNEPSHINTCGRIIAHANASTTADIKNLQGNYYWFEQDCNQQYRYICKRTLQTPPPFVSPTSSKRKENSSSKMTSIAAGVAVMACFILATAILAAMWLVRRKRKEKALAKSHVTIVPVDEPFAQATLEHDPKSPGAEYSSEPKSTHDSKAYRTDNTNNTILHSDNTCKLAKQTVYADIQFSSSRRQQEPPKRDGRAVKPLPQRQVEYADLSFTKHTNQRVLADSYVDVRALNGVMEYASACDVTPVNAFPLTETYGNIPKPAKPQLVVKPQPQNTHVTKETTPSSDDEREMPLYAVPMKKQ